MTRTTERLVLRPWRETDAESLYRYACDGQVGPAAGWKPHESVEESRQIIRTVLSQPDTLAVLLRERPEEAIGSVGVFPTDAPDGKGEPEIGYWIGRPFWGQGLIPEAVRELLRWCFMERGAARVWCGYSRGMTSPAASSRSAGSPMFATGLPFCGLTDRRGSPVTTR